MKRLKLLSRMLALVVILALVFTACGSATTTNNTSTTTEKVKLVFGWWGDKLRHDATMKAITLWNSKHPEIQVEGAFQGWDGYSQKLITQFAGDSAPDIFQISGNDLESIANSNQLLDLTLYKDTYFAGIDQTLWVDLTFNGKISAVASGINGGASVYNKTKTDKYGLAPLVDNDTMETLLEKCKKAVLDTNGDGKTDLWGNFDPMDTDPATYNGWVRCWGLSVWTPDLLGSDFTNPDIINILKKYEQFRKAKVIVPPDVSIMGGESYMGAGYIVYDGTPLSAYQTGVTSTKDELVLGMPQLPFAGGKDMRAAGTGLPIAINAKTKHPEQSAKFLSWLLTDPEAALTMGMARGVFPSKAQRDAALSTLSPVEKSVVEVANKLQALGNGNIGAAKQPLQYGRFLDIFTQEKNRYLLDMIDLNQFMENIQKAGAPVLAGN